MRYEVPTDFYYRLHHIRPRFKGQIENVLVFMATHITDLGIRKNEDFKEEFNKRIRLYPGNADRALKTINNWRTEISSLFGLFIEGEEYTKPGLRAQELTNDQDLLKFFKIFLYNFEYPGGHLKNHEIVDLCKVGIYFKPVNYIIEVYSQASEFENKEIYLDSAEVTHCIFNDLRVTRDKRSPIDTWNLIKENRAKKVTYDTTGDVVRYAGDILDYMSIANLLIKKGNSRFILNANEPSLSIYRQSQRRFEGYKNFIGNTLTTIDDIRDLRVEWFEYMNDPLSEIDFETDLSTYIPDLIPESKESIIIDLHDILSNKDSVITSAVGSSGESFIINHEKEKLTQSGQNNLTHLVNFIPTNLGVGYDVQSLEDDGSELRKYIEVKTTVSNASINFNSVHITPNEWRTAKSVKDRYYIYRLSLSKHSQKLFIINNIYEKVKNKEIVLNERSDGYDIMFYDSSGYEEGIFNEKT